LIGLPPTTPTTLASFSLPHPLKKASQGSLLLSQKQWSGSARKQLSAPRHEALEEVAINEWLIGRGEFIVDPLLAYLAEAEKRSARHLQSD